jgi:hypothetical protein
LEIPTQRVFIGENNEATVICGQCGTHKRLAVTPEKHYGKVFRVKCGCGSLFNVLFEPRKSYRKITQLYGLCFKQGSDVLLSEVLVTDISRKGVGFTIESRAFDLSRIQKGDILKLEFQLDNQPQTVIKTKLVVQSIKGRSIGAEFYFPDSNTVKEIGFYLLP